MKTTGHLDWIAVTFPADATHKSLLPAQIAAHKLAPNGMGNHGYLKRWMNDLGVVVLSDGAPAMGTHVYLTGEALENVRALPVTDFELVTHILDHNGRGSRVDVAVNILDGELTFEELERAYLAQRIKTRARSATVIKSLDNLEGTVYVGNRNSERMFRAYNKGAQMGQEEPWLRLELESKKMQARALLDAISSQPDTRSVINAALHNFVDFPDLAEYQTALADHDAKIPPVPRKMTNSLRWLLEICAPALARTELEQPDYPVFDAFMTSYGIALSLIKTRQNNPDNLTKPPNIE